MGAYRPSSAIQRSALEDLLALENAVLDNRFRWGARLDFLIKSPKDKLTISLCRRGRLRQF